MNRQSHCRHIVIRDFRQLTFGQLCENLKPIDFFPAFEPLKNKYK